MGIVRFWKRKKPVLSVAVEPAASPVITQAKAGQPLKGAPHRIQGSLSLPAYLPIHVFITHQGIVSTKLFTLGLQGVRN